MEELNFASELLDNHKEILYFSLRKEAYHTKELMLEIFMQEAES